jgi:hypothetical protein
MKAKQASPARPSALPHPTPTPSRRRAAPAAHAPHPLPAPQHFFMDAAMSECADPVSAEDVKCGSGTKGAPTPPCAAAPRRHAARPRSPVHCPAPSPTPHRR